MPQQMITQNNQQSLTQNNQLNLTQNNQIKKENPNYDNINFNDVLNCKNINDDIINKEFNKLKALNCTENTRSFCGNKIIYNYQLNNMLNTRRDTKGRNVIFDDLLEEIFNDDWKKQYWINQTIKINRRKKNDFIDATDIYECYRLCRGSINTFKPATTKYLCNKFKATKMLDFTAGWGGRLLGARSLGIEYTGIDTNINLKNGYDKMINKFGGKMIYESCLDVDFSKIDYDFVLTSPPYINLELYDNMTPFESKEIFYKEFLIPMINKSLKYIKRNGSVCINISNYMYDDYIKYGGKPCIDKIDLLQQMGGKPNKEMVYIFRKLKFNIIKKL
tara:strand:+ start:85 stop:1083 length:999 start_codon:yes stop_codon:yes gene_type:complete